MAASSLVTQFDVQTNLRAALQDEAQWARNYIVSSLSSAPDATLASEHLLAAEVEIGAALQQFYAADTNRQLSAALRDHAFGLVAIVTATTGPRSAACSLNPSVSCDAKSAWYANADHIAQLIAGGSESLNISYTNTRASLFAQLDATLAEIASVVANGDAGSYDLVGSRAEAVADAMTKAILVQYPIMTSDMSKGVQLARNEARPLFEDGTFAMHEAIVSHIARDAQEPTVVDRLVRSATDLGNLFEPYLGAGPSAQITALFHADITDAYAYMLAKESGNTAGAMTLRADWYADVDTLADYLASQNASWASVALRAKLHADAEQTATEIDARLAQDWQSDANAYDVAIVNIRSLSDTLVDGLAR